MRNGLVVAAVGFLLSAACAPSRSDLTLNWTFNGGQTCAQAGVSSVQVDIQGEALTPNVFSCQNPNGTLNGGAYLGRYLLGNYNLTLSGLDAQARVIYQAVAVVTVRSGGSVITLDAPAAGTAPGNGGGGGSATLRYTFAGKSCAAANVTVVHVSVDGTVLQDAANNADLPCSQQGVDGISVSPLSPGSHVFDIAGLVNGQVAYVQQGLAVNVTAGQDTSLTPSIPAAAPTTGSAELGWSFVNGMTCAQAQVDNVHVYFDPAADGTGGVDAGTVPCFAAGVNGATFDGLAPGSHTARIVASRHTTAGDKLVYATTTPPPPQRFEAGLITALDVSADATNPGAGGSALIWQFPAGGPSCSGAASTTISYTLVSPAKAVTSGTATCGGSSNGIELCPASTPNCAAAGLWSISATTPGYAAQNVAFAVPNGAHSSAAVVFVAH